MRVAITIVTAVAVVATTGCLSSFSKKTPTPETTPSAGSAAPASACSTDEIGPSGGDELRSLRARVDAQQVELLASRAEADALRHRLHDQQAALEEAIQEVVRARAKQRSVESRAQAATEIAEAEIALERLTATTRATPEAAQARKLLEGASAEFDAENFGGALYLATQSKSRIRLAGARAPRTESGVEGETAFGAPISLEVVRRANVRRGPGTDHPVLRTLDAGARLTGHAAKGSWIRTTDETDASGWIHRSLVGERGSVTAATR